MQGYDLSVLMGPQLTLMGDIRQSVARLFGILATVINFPLLARRIFPLSLFEPQ
jgi:hypothetical protein